MGCGTAMRIQHRGAKTDLMNDVRSVTSNRFGGALKTLLLLAVILTVGAWLRTVGLDWGGSHLLHPDERFLLMVTTSLVPVDSWASYFNTLGSTLIRTMLGYGFYVHGDWPVMFLSMSAQIESAVTIRDPCAGPRPVGHSRSVDRDCSVLSGQTPFDRRVGLVAAVMYAVTGLRSNNPTSSRSTPSLLYLCRHVLCGSGAHSPSMDRLSIVWPYARAVRVQQSKCVSLALILVLALALRVWRESQALQGDGSSPSPDVQAPTRIPTSLILRAAAGLLIAGIVAVLTFRVGQPYAFLPPNSGYPVEEEKLGALMSSVSTIADPVGFRPNPLWLDQMAEVRRQVSGYSDIPPNHQWGKRLPLVFPWVNMVRVGMGWPLDCGAGSLSSGQSGRSYGHARSLRLLLPVVWIGSLYLAGQRLVKRCVTSCLCIRS
jgi:hypothetical protein